MYTVLVAIDDSTERAMRQARAVADLPNDDVHAVLFHVFSGENVEGASVHQIAAVRRAKEHLEEAGIEVTLAESSGHAVEELLEAAREHDADMITVSGRGRSPAGKALLGSVSQEVLLRAERPVLYCGVEPIEE